MNVDEYGFSLVFFFFYFWFSILKYYIYKMLKMCCVAYIFSQISQEIWNKMLGFPSNLFIRYAEGIVFLERAHTSYFQQ